jgi:hypothetical protein
MSVHMLYVYATYNRGQELGGLGTEGIQVTQYLQEPALVPCTV